MASRKIPSARGHDTLNHIEGVIGSAFDDHLYGGGTSEQDFLQTFRGGAGDDFIDGRSGNDRAEYNDATGAITVNLAAGTVSGAGIGNDTLRSVEDIRGSAFNDIYNAAGFNAVSTNAGSQGTFNNFRPEEGDDTIIGNGDTQLDYFDAPHGVVVNLADRSVNATTGVVHGGVGVGDDTFSGVDRVRGSIICRCPERRTGRVQRPRRGGILRRPGRRRRHRWRLGLRLRPLSRHHRPHQRHRGRKSALSTAQARIPCTRIRP